MLINCDARNISNANRLSLISALCCCCPAATWIGADNEHIRLEEDITLAGFTPLFCNVPMEIYCHRDVDKEIAQVSFFLV